VIFSELFSRQYIMAYDTPRDPICHCHISISIIIIRHHIHLLLLPSHHPPLPKEMMKRANEAFYQTPRFQGIDLLPPPLHHYHPLLPKGMIKRANKSATARRVCDAVQAEMPKESIFRCLLRGCRNDSC